MLVQERDDLKSSFISGILALLLKCGTGNYMKHNRKSIVVITDGRLFIHIIIGKIPLCDTLCDTTMNNNNSTSNTQGFIYTVHTEEM